MPQSAETIFRDFTTDGIPASGRHEPRKVEVREWGTNLEAFLTAGTSGASVLRTSLASLNSALTYDASTMAWVIGDPVSANNGVYQKLGASGSGSWERRADLPYSFIRALNVGAGTPNAIQATSSIPIPIADAGALVALNIFEANTGAATVSFNGGSALTVVGVGGEPVGPGDLISGMIVAGYKSGTAFRLITDTSSAANKASAEAAQTAAEAARDAAEGAAETVVVARYNSKAGVEAATVNVAVQSLQTTGFAVAGDGGGAIYKRVVSEPAHAGKIQSADGAWWEIAEGVISPLMLGAARNAAANQTAPMQAWLDAMKATGAEGYIPNGTYRVDGEVTTDMSGLRVRCHRKAVLDASNAATGTYSLTLSGTIGTYANITAGNAQLGAARLRTTSAFAGTLAVGDVIKIKSGNIYDSFNTNMLYGELNIVTGLVDAATGYVDVEYPLSATYSTSPQLAKISPIADIEWEGLKIVGAVAEQNNQKGMRLRYAKDFRIAHFVGERIDDRVFWVQDSLLGEMDGVGGRDARPSSTGYGISFIDACQDIRAHHGRYSRVRHALSTNNQSGAGGIPRRIQFEDNDVTGGAFARGGSMGPGDAIDTHGAAEDISIERNTVTGCPGQGINFECRSGTIRNNKIVACAGNGISVHNESDLNGSVVVSGNTIQRAGGARSIYVTNATRGASSFYESAVIDGNIAEGGLEGIRVNFPAANADIRNVILANNIVRGHSGVGIYAFKSRGFVCSGNTVDGELQGAGNSPLRLTDCIDGVIADNVLLSPTGATIATILVSGSTGGASTRIEVSGNRAGGRSAVITPAGVQFDNNVTQSGVHNNNLRTSAGVSLGTGTGNVQANNIV